MEVNTFKMTFTLTLLLLYVSSISCEPQEGPFAEVAQGSGDGGLPVSSTTPDPRAPFLMAVDKETMNEFQNNEQGAKKPSPTAPPSKRPKPILESNIGNFDRTFRDKNRNRNVPKQNIDQFGNPLGDIHGIDTSRVELGAGSGGQQVIKCPRNWVRYKESCYKFTRSPIKIWSDARALCQAFRHDDKEHADLASVDSYNEHRFITEYLNRHDPQHRRWYISTRQESGVWMNQGDGTQMQNLERFFIKGNEWGETDNFKKDYLTYAFSLKTREWGFQPVYGHEEYLYICEIPLKETKYLIDDDRTAEYGQPIGDPRYIPMGPYFIRQPNHTVFDMSKRQIVNDVNMLCIAAGWPTPTYEWFKEEYVNNTLTKSKIQPLLDSRFTISGGQLIINSPDQTIDKGTYYCTANNDYGTIRSRSVSMSFGFIGEFILRRSNEVGRENWGKAISCDPPHHFPAIKYYWARDYFPNFVEEDRRVMVSFDGYIYFTALENIDKGNYSCSVQSSVSNIGRNGPFFTIDVLPHPNYQQLRFPQNFPKSFPEAPVAGDDVRLECIAFGYPVPHYNWTRTNGVLPDGAIVTNYNRVLILPKIRVEDEGHYECKAHNDKVSITGKIKLSIQARPVFTIPIGDMHVDEKDDVIWVCEAFGRPDVQYAWLKNGRPLTADNKTLDVEDRGRYIIKDNVLKITQVRKDRDQGMYQCKAYNDLDTRYSSGQLRVLGFKPTFIKYPVEESIYAAEGGNLTIECKPEAAPLPTFKWYKNGDLIGSGGKYTIYKNGNLFIEQANREDEGQYRCVAENEYGTGDSDNIANVFVRKGPTFRQGVKPNPRIIRRRGKNIELRCKAMADDILDRAYYWKLNGDIISFVEEEEIQRLLELKNAAASRVNQLAFISLDDTAPSVLSHTSWFQNDYNTNSRKTKGTGDFRKFFRGRLDGDMIIKNISIAETGIYECCIETVVGSLYGTSEVIVHSEPGPPGGVTAQDLLATSGKVIWTDGARYGPKILNYRIEGKTNHNQTWQLLGDKVEGITPENIGGTVRIDGRRQYALDNISPWAAYNFRVAAYNELGLGEWSETSPSYNTKPDKPYKSVSNIRSDGGRTGDLTIRWDPLPIQDQNAPGIYYRIFYKRAGPDPERYFQQKTLKNVGNNGMSVIRIPREHYYTPYKVKMQVFNDMCEEPTCDGPVSDEYEVLSAEDLPQVAPTTVGARPFNSTAIRVSWLPIPDTREKLRGKLIGHRIKYWREDLDEVTESQYVLSRDPKPEAHIIGLLPNTYYWVRVMAYNSAGPGPESERFLERTFKLRPQKPPSAVQVYGINPSTVRVTWRYVSPSVSEEPLTGYKVRVWEMDTEVKEANDTTIYIGNKLEAFISNLGPGKTYNLRVLAFSQGGEGKMSSPAWQFQMGDPDQLNASVGTMASKITAVLLPMVVWLASRTKF